jgi:hypothetical protein
MQANLRNAASKALMVPSTAVLYLLLLFCGQFLGIARWAVYVCRMFPVQMHGGTLFWCVLVILETPIFLISGLAAALFMVLVFRCTSWQFGLTSAVIAVIMGIYVMGPGMISFDALSILSLPAGCLLLGRAWKSSNHSAPPITARVA